MRNSLGSLRHITCSMIDVPALASIALSFKSADPRRAGSTGIYSAVFFIFPSVRWTQRSRLIRELGQGSIRSIGGFFNRWIKYTEVRDPAHVVVV